LANANGKNDEYFQQIINNCLVILHHICQMLHKYSSEDIFLAFDHIKLIEVLVNIVKNVNKDRYSFKHREYALKILKTFLTLCTNDINSLLNEVAVFALTRSHIESILLQLLEEPTKKNNNSSSCLESLAIYILHELIEHYPEFKVAYSQADIVPRLISFLSAVDKEGYAGVIAEDNIKLVIEIL
jgi:hypothetical protein